MFGIMWETQAKCGHWVIWDAKAPHTAHWSEASVRRDDCLICQLAKARADYERAIEVHRAFSGR